MHLTGRKLPQCLALILIVILFADIAVWAGRASKRRSLRARFASVMREIHYYRNRLRQTKRLQSRAFADMEDARDRLSATRDSIESLESRIRLVRLQVKLIRQRLVRIQAKLDRHKAALGQRLASIYRNGSVSYVSVVCNSGDYWDFLSRSHYAKRVVDSDVDLIQQIKEEREDIAYGKRLLDRKKTQISRLFFRLQAVKMAQRQEASEKLEEFKDISQQRAYFEQHLAQLEQNSREIEEMIRRLAVTPQGRARMARPWRGGFIRPVNGRITSGFGYRQHPILKRYKLHTGTDLAAPSGTPIRAAAGGVVIHAGWWGAYGNCVIIDHGGGVSTLYGHCSSLSVSNGQSVKQGQTIGRVGSTGFSTGPHLHFEVRQNGVPRNPL